ncbi:hypothetical protein GCM10008967_24160 [Bacillus carboniphilus]|uniref:DUF5320 domain-containing protein n=1 Tax=Bacillus carboniphilus TaxID=86663 RepID=A0ABN0WCD1_9BACI
MYYRQQQPPIGQGGVYIPIPGFPGGGSPGYPGGGYPGGGGQSLERRVSQLERQVDRLNRQFDRLDRRIERIERRLGIGQQQY